MKYLIPFLLTAATVLGQQTPLHTSASTTGHNIVNPAFRNSVLPNQGTHAGKYLKTNGTAATWETVTSGTTYTGTAGEITVSGSVLSLPSALTYTGKTITGGTYVSPTLTTPIIADAALTIAKTNGLQTALDAKSAKASNLSDLANAATARGNLGLGSVDNTSDASKPVSSLTQTALDARQLLMSGVIVTKANGTRTAYPPSAGTNDLAGDTARGLALEAAFAAAATGDTIDLSPGNYYVAKTATSVDGLTVQYQILDRMTLRLNGARLYHTATESTWVMFAGGNTTTMNDWTILGPGIIEGSDASPDDTGPNTENGISIRGTRRYRISGITARYFKGVGISVVSTGTSGYGTTLNSNLKISSGIISDCHLDYNNEGFASAPTCEFMAVINTTANNCRTGFNVYAGNTRFVNCDANASLRYGVLVRNHGGNKGHGSWIGGHICHNVLDGINVEASMDSGFIFTGVTMGADNVTSNKITVLGGGVNFVNCYIECPFFASSTPTGLNYMSNCFIAGTYTAITDLSAAERAQWRFLNNHTLTGRWVNDDNRSGESTLTGGTSGSISFPQITAASVITVSRKTARGTLGAGGYAYTIVAGTGFTINSVDLSGALSMLDTSDVTWSVNQP